MSNQPMPHPNEEPFVVEVSHRLHPNNSITPSARVLIGRGIPELARDIGMEAIGELCVLMGFVTPNGAVGPSAAALSAALGRPALLLRLRLHRLARRYWRGQPVLRVVRRESGWETFHPSPIVLGHRDAVPHPATVPTVAPAGRERIVEASRAAYARPREEVEREIRARQGWPHPQELEELAESRMKPPSELDERWAVERLAKEKVDYALAQKLVKEYGAERCLKQLRLLPYRRGIKSKSRYIVKAIQDDFAPPEIGE